MTDQQQTPDSTQHATSSTPPPGWAQELMGQMELGHARPDWEALSDLAAAVTQAHPEDPDAGIAAVFIAGYAAGLAEGTEQADFDRAHRMSVRALQTMMGRSA